MPVISPVGAKRSRTNTRARLIEAAYDVFSELGFQTATIEDVCSGAGFTRGAFYSNFNTKDELFLALWDTEANRIVGAVRTLAARLTTGAVAMDEVLASIGSLYDQRWFQLNTEFLLYALRNPNVAQLLSDHRAQLRQELGEAVAALLEHDHRTLRPDIDLDTLTRLIIAAHEGCQHQSLVEPNLARPLEPAILDGLLARYTETETGAAGPTT